jgi:hypothetical protein
MKILSNRTLTGRSMLGNNGPLITKLINFKNQHYGHYFNGEIIDIIHYDQTLQSLAVQIRTEYENNIKCHFVKYVDKYVNVCMNKKDVIDIINNDNDKSPKEKKN